MCGDELGGIDGFLFAGSHHATMDIKDLIDLLKIQIGFQQVPPDPYVKDGTRHKDIVRFTNPAAGRVVKSPHGDLVHPINAGSYGGHSSRSYAEIPASDIDALTPLIEFFSRVAGVEPGREVLLQRQRVVANNQTAKTVQEGRHQDGLKKLAILCIARKNIKGGISYLSNERGERVFAGTLKPGQILFVDDKRLWHDASPILPVKAGLPAYRDVILLNWPAERREDHLPENSVIAPYYPSC